MSHHRREAVMRVPAFLVSIIGAFILQFVIILAIIWGIVDVLIEFVLDRDFLTEDSMPARLIRAGVMWPVDNFVFAVTGKGGPMWLPQM